MKPTRALLHARGELEDLQRRHGEIERRCGELETIVEERNESVQNLVLERDQLIAQRDELVMQNAEIGQQLVDQGARYNQVVKDGERAREDARTAEKGRLAAESDNAFLRDTMHELTIQKSRLEGQLERVRQFDPVTDQQAHQEGLINVRMPRHYVDGEALTSTSRSQPWYRRG
jgi:chromosome segregation ATPase